MDKCSNPGKTQTLPCKTAENTAENYCLGTDDRNGGIYGRDSFFETAAAMISEKKPGYYILSCINIDNFKVINDRYGTDIGDKVLKYVAESISDDMKDMGGICGRIAGDDFALLFPAEYANSGRLAFGYQKATSPDCIPQKMRIRVGRYTVTDLSEPVTAMYDRAKLAANSIRTNYEKNIEMYNDSMRVDLVHKQKIVDDMRESLANGEFEAWFQPQYNHATGAVIGAEALVRWEKDGKFISPAEFIPIFEQNGFIYEMDRYMWEQVCIKLRNWIDEGISPLPVSVNISRRDILHSDFTDVLMGLLKKYDVPVKLFRIEITETAFADSEELISEKVAELISLGFVVEIDDFGSGYSTLNTLKDVPSSVLKLDMKFFESTKNSRRAGNIVESVVRMAKWLGMAVIAEGVEQKEQADYLKSIGCYYIQGFYYAKPMPAEDYEKMLENCSKEQELSRLKTIENHNHNEFWNPNSMETLIFNSYVGGACIFEYNNGATEVLRINDRYCKEFGGIIPEGTEISDVGISRYIIPADRDKFFKTLKLAADADKEQTCEVRACGNGKNEYLRVTVRVIARTDERLLFYAVVVNTTELHEAQANERNASKQLNTIVDSINGSVIVSLYHAFDDIDIIYLNDGFYSMFGYTKEQYETEVAFINDLILPDDRAYASQMAEKVNNTHKSLTYEYRCRKRDGSIIWVQMTNSLIPLDGISDKVLLGVATDITSQKLLVQKEAEISDKLGAVLNTAENGITAATVENGKVSFIIANDKFYEIHGLPKGRAEDISIEVLKGLTHDSDKKLVREKIKDAFANGKKLDIVYRIVRPDGNTVWLKTISAMTNISGISKPVYVTVFSDVSDEINAYGRLKFLNDSAHEILAQHDTDMAIQHTLMKMLDYFGANRAYVFEFDYSDGTTSNTYEVCAPGIEKEIDLLKKIPVSTVDCWIEMFKRKGYLAIDNVHKMENDDKLRKILLMQNIESIIVSPLKRDGELVGFVGVDNPSNDVNGVQYLAALGDYIAVLITRRDLSAKIEEERKLSEELLDNIPCGAVLYEYDGKNITAIHLNKRYKQMTGRPEYSPRSISAPVEFVHPDDRENFVYDVINDAIVHNKSAQCSLRIMCGDGQYRSFEVDANIKKRSDGKYLIYATFK